MITRLVGRFCRPGGCSRSSTLKVSAWAGTGTAGIGATGTETSAKGFRECPVHLIKNPFCTFSVGKSLWSDKNQLKFIHYLQFQFCLGRHFWHWPDVKHCCYCIVRWRQLTETTALERLWERAEELAEEPAEGPAEVLPFWLVPPVSWRVEEERTAGRQPAPVCLPQLTPFRASNQKRSYLPADPPENVCRIVRASDNSQTQQARPANLWNQGGHCCNL